jgi:sulfur-oxidizing protein SoxX
MNVKPALLLGFLGITACMPSPESAVGFRLPDGDADSGREAFVDLQCHGCHTISGLDLEFTGTGAVRVELGGQVSRVRTYGELVTSIINPSHRLAPGYDRDYVTTGGESIMTMAYINEVMTVQQLVDVVAFLQAQYDVAPPSDFRDFMPP